MGRVSIVGILEEVKNRLAPAAGEKSIIVQVDAQMDLPPVRADANRIEQVVMNLVHNAIKFTPEGGSITLRARRQGRGVQVDVADTGVGMDAAEAARIFERFYKVDRGRSRTDGAGLGLAISRHLLDLHGGHLQVVSEVGRGSRFSFALPLAE
jgi:two-component system phosphate regulon sensor histidine kinase PhoR